MKKKNLLEPILFLALLPLLVPLKGIISNAFTTSLQLENPYKLERQILEGATIVEADNIFLKSILSSLQEKIVESTKEIISYSPYKEEELTMTLRVAASPEVKPEIKKVIPVKVKKKVIVKTKKVVAKKIKKSVSLDRKISAIVKKVAAKKRVITKRRNKKRDEFFLTTKLPFEVKGIKTEKLVVQNWSSSLDKQLAQISKKLQKIEIAETEIKEDKISVKMAKNNSYEYPKINLSEKENTNNIVTRSIESKISETVLRAAKLAHKNKVVIPKSAVTVASHITPKRLVKREPAVLKYAIDNEQEKIMKAGVENKAISFESMLKDHPVFMSNQGKSVDPKKEELVATVNIQKDKLRMASQSKKSIQPDNKGMNALIAANIDEKPKTEAAIINDAIKKFVKKDYSQPIQRSRKTVKKKSHQTYRAKVVVKGYEALMNKGAKDYVNNFELKKLYDDYAHSYNDSEGSVVLNEKLVHKTGTAQYVLSKSGFYDTKFQVLFEEGSFAMNVPFFEQESLDEFLTAQKVYATGGFILIEMDPETKSVELNDSKFFTNFYLNEDFKIVKGNEDVAFMLFVGVEPGNGLLSYETKKGERVDKIIHVSENEVLFELNSYKNKEIHTISISETEVFGKSSTEFKLLPEHMNGFNSDKLPLQLGPNRFDFKWAKSDLSFRNYIEFNHLGDNIYVGYKENRDLEIPTNDFIVHVFNQFKINDIAGRCLTQINLERRPSSSTMAAYSTNGPMSYQVLYQDENGKFYDEISEQTRKVFILGEYQGMINTSIQYKNGAKDFLTTPCSDDTYLVEQL